MTHTALINAIVLVLIALPSQALGQFGTELQDHFNSLTGLESSGSLQTFEVQGIETAIELIGFGFCLPGDPTLPPVNPPTAMSNVYGCQNNAIVTDNPFPQLDGTSFELAIDDLFLDLSTTRDQSILCGELGSGKRTDDAYATLSISIFGEVNFVEQNGCIRWVISQISTELVLGDLFMDFDDPCLSEFASAATSVVLPVLQTELATLFLEEIDDFLAARNLTACGVPVSGASWSALKASFDNP